MKIGSPSLKTKFQADTVARTMVPASWHRRVLFSQCRWWINSMVPNLCNPVQLCCFLDRLFVYLDLNSALVGTVRSISFEIFLTI